MLREQRSETNRMDKVKDVFHSAQTHSPDFISVPARLFVFALVQKCALLLKTQHPHGFKSMIENWRTLQCAALTNEVFFFYTHIHIKNKTKEEIKTWCSWLRVFMRSSSPCCTYFTFSTPFILYSSKQTARDLMKPSAAFLHHFHHPLVMILSQTPQLQSLMNFQHREVGVANYRWCLHKPHPLICTRVFICWNLNGTFVLL